MPSNNFFPTDKYDEALVTIDTVHHEVHEGHCFAFHYENRAPTSGASIYLHLKSGAKSPHIFIDFEALGGLLEVIMYKDAIVSTVGTAISFYDRNHNTNNSPISTLFVGTTFSTVGTIFANRLVLGSSGGASKANSAIREGAERCWKPNTDYIISLKPLATSMAITVDGLMEEVAL